jgi:sugar/nucleoside kinase (ribokinase family)
MVLGELEMGRASRLKREKRQQRQATKQMEKPQNDERKPISPLEFENALDQALPGLGGRIPAWTKQKLHKMAKIAKKTQTKVSLTPTSAFYESSDRDTALNLIDISYNFTFNHEELLEMLKFGDDDGVVDLRQLIAYLRSKQ